MKEFFLMIFTVSAFNFIRSAEEVHVYVQTADQLFIDSILPELESYLESKSIALMVFENSSHIPIALTSTPGIVYFNGPEKFIYSGRYMEFNSLKNFVRTNKYRISKSEPLCSKETLIRQKGRMKIQVKKKITEVKSANQKMSNTISIINSLNVVSGSFQKESMACLEQTDRTYYLDIHPYLDRDSTLYLSYELYSQFDCIEPVYSALSSPVVGPLNLVDQLSEELFADIERRIQMDLNSSKIGDRVSPIKSETSDKSWPALLMNKKTPNDSGFSLPEVIPREWQVMGPIAKGDPMVVFQFPPPLNRYGGEVKKFAGTLAIDESGKMQGVFNVEVNSMTMGMQDLDLKVLSKYLKASRFKTSSFQFEEAKVAKLEWGKPTTFIAFGNFQLMKSVKLTKVSGTILPTIDSKNNPILQISAAFEIPIDQFKIKGPDGPESARNTVLVNLNFNMKTKNN